MQKEERKFVNSDLMEVMPSISALIKGIEQQTNERRIKRVLVDRSKQKAKRAELRFLEAKAKQLGFSVEMVEGTLIDGMTVGNTHGGIIAECTDRRLPHLASEHIKDQGVYFILDGVEDPYNFGYAVRSLYAAGVDGLILGERNWLGAAGVVARSSAGTSELMPLFVAEAPEAVNLFKKKGYRVLCAGIRDSVSLFDTELDKPLLVILGGEKRGISRSLLEMADQIVRIDYGTSFGGSLSTSAAAAVFTFEILRVNREL